MSASSAIFFGVVLIFAGLATNSPAVIVPGMLVLLVVGVARLWTNDSLQKSLSLHLWLKSHRAKPGDVIEGFMEVRNDQPFPLPWLECAMEWPQDLKTSPALLSPHHKANRQVLRNIFSLRWFERVRRRFEVYCSTRGEFFFGPVELSLYDPFGFSEAKRTVLTQERLVVYPKTVEIGSTHLRQQSPFGDRAARSFIYEDPSRQRGAREYLPSDPFSKVEWKTTARTARLHTRVLDASFAAETAIVADVTTGEQPWDGVRRDLFERTVMVAAACVRRVFMAGHRFGLYTNGFVRSSAGPASARTGSGREQYMTCLDLLGRLLLVRGSRPEAVLAITGKKLSEHAQIILVTGLLTPPLLKEIERQRVSGRAISVILTEDSPSKSRIKAPVYVVREQENAEQIEQITLDKASN